MLIYAKDHHSPQSFVRGRRFLTSCDKRDSTAADCGPWKYAAFMLLAFVIATCHVQSLVASVERPSATPEPSPACEERRQNRPTHNNHFRDTVQINKARWIWNAGNELPALLRRMTILRNELIEKCDKRDRTIWVADDSRSQISIRAFRTAERVGLMKTN